MKDFTKLWAAQSVSLIGSQVSIVAIPLLVIRELHAGPATLGVLRTVETLPYLLFSLLAGVAIDRLGRQKAVLFAGDLLRLLALAAFALLAVAGQLTLPLAIIVAAVVGSCSMVYDIATMSFTPELVAKSGLLRANSRLYGSNSVAQTMGPGAAGLVTSIFGAPAAVLMDAASYLGSAGFIATIKSRGSAVSTRPAGNTWRQLKDGLRCVLSNATLRSLAISGFIFFLGYDAFTTLYVLYLNDILRFNAVIIGVVIAAAGIGAILGSVFSRPLSGKVGIGWCIALAPIFGSIGIVLTAVATGARQPTAVLLVVCGQVVLGFWGAIFTTQAATVRQVEAPAGMLARVSSIYRLSAYGAMPIAGVLAAVLGQLIGIRNTFWVAALLVAVAALTLIAGSIRTYVMVDGDASSPPADGSN